jgi:hypothetical protein
METIWDPEHDGPRWKFSLTDTELIDVWKDDSSYSTIDFKADSVRVPNGTLECKSLLLDGYQVYKKTDVDNMFAALRAELRAYGSLPPA